MLFYIFALCRCGCSDRTSVQEQFYCWAENLPSIYKSVRTPFMKCVLDCENNDDKLSCTKECMKIPNPIDATEDCILGCSSIKDPINQNQCLNNCRQMKRLEPNDDFEDSYSRCRSFHNFMMKTRPEKEPLKSTLEALCSEKLNVFPICQAIAKITYEQMYLLYQEFQESSSFCIRLGLVQK